ncbi:hypothetical protein BKA69DRAFT_937576 [Paraphysoderma sedebokerense]|nr:hypothetical protein BKA69DRAFT_937576 [Paraphysoderma sedebokerense]
MDRDKRRQNEMHEKILQNMIISDPANSLCADCGAKGPRWASYNLGVFLCIRCGGLHRKLGTHISRVKSITLDSWTPEQMESMTSQGNAKANAKYNPGNVKCPNQDSDITMEQYIRDKYERKTFMNGSSRNTSTMDSRRSSVGTNYGNMSSTNSSLSSKYAAQISRLRDMGFTYDEWNIKALEKSNGDVQNAVEHILSMGPPPVTASSAPSRAPALPRRDVMSNAMMVADTKSPFLSQLRAMGFTDDTANLAALQKADGKFELAISYLTDRRHELDTRSANIALTNVTGSTNSDPFGPSSSTFSNTINTNSTGASSFVPSNQSSGSGKKQEALIDLLGGADPFAPQTQMQTALGVDPFGQFPAQPQQQNVQQSQNAFSDFTDLNMNQQSAKPKLAKDNIMSLYQSNTQPSMGMGAGMGGPMGMGGMNPQMMGMGMQNGMMNPQMGMMNPQMGMHGMGGGMGGMQGGMMGMGMGQNYTTVSMPYNTSTAPRTTNNFNGGMSNMQGMQQQQQPQHQNPFQMGMGNQQPMGMGMQHMNSQNQNQMGMGGGNPAMGSSMMGYGGARMGQGQAQGQGQGQNQNQNQNLFF